MAPAPVGKGCERRAQAAGLVAHAPLDACCSGCCTATRPSPPVAAGRQLHVGWQRDERPPCHGSQARKLLMSSCHLTKFRRAVCSRQAPKVLKRQLLGYTDSGQAHGSLLASSALLSRLATATARASSLGYQQPAGPHFSKLRMDSRPASYRAPSSPLMRALSSVLSCPDPVVCAFTSMSCAAAASQPLLQAGSLSGCELLSACHDACAQLVSSTPEAVCPFCW